MDRSKKWKNIVFKNTNNLKSFKHTWNNYCYFTWTNKLSKDLEKKLACFTEQKIFGANFKKEVFEKSIVLFLLNERFYWKIGKKENGVENER